MKKTLTVALALIFVFAATSAYACGEKNGAAKAEATKVNAEVQKADAGSCAPGAKAMTAEAQKTEGAASCTYNKDAKAKAQNADVNTEKASGCVGKASKASDSQKAEVKPEEKKASNPVLIMSAPNGTTNNQ